MRKTACWQIGWTAAALVVVVSCCSGCTKAPTALGGPAAPGANHRVSVKTIAPSKIELARTTTQPATVHADFEAKIYARVSGYLSRLDADIGDSVEQGQVLATIDVPEMSRQRQAKLAGIQRLLADEQRAQAEMEVAAASIDSYQAKLKMAGANVQKADAHLAASRVELQRVSDLVEQKAVAERLLDEAKKKHEAAQAERTAAEAAVASADAELALSRAKSAAAAAQIEVARALTDVARRELDELDELMNYAELKAPFAGVVTARNVELGDLVRNTQATSGKDVAPLFVVAKVDKVRIRVAVPERDAPLVTVGDAARVSLQALGGQPLTGQLSRVSRSLDPRTRTMLVEIDLPNGDGLLLPGMFGQATITLEAAKTRLVLPANVIRFDDKGKSTVYVVDASSVIQVVEVTTGWDDGQQIEITTGLRGDERVVESMLRRLKQGQVVAVEKN